MKKVLFISIAILSVTSQISLSQSDTLMPRLKDYENFRTFIAMNIRYPIYAAENGISGTVEYTFIIDEKGCLDSIEIISSPDQTLSDEVTRTVKMTKCNWIPGSINGAPAKLELNSKSNFKIE